MKKTFIFLIFSQFCFSQIDSGSYTSKYISHYKLADNDYVENVSDSGWLDCDFYFDPRNEYFEVQCEGDEPFKEWFQYIGEDEIGGVMCDVYETREGNELIIDYDNNEISYYFNPIDGYFDGLMVFSKIEKTED